MYEFIKDEIETAMDVIMEQNKHVYCTHCEYFRLTWDCRGTCKYEKKCNMECFVDSKRFSERPYYKEKKERE